MKEVRLSIPVIGGITVVYTKEDIDTKVATAKQHMLSGVACVRRGIAMASRYTSVGLTNLANRIESR